MGQGCRSRKQTWLGFEVNKIFYCASALCSFSFTQDKIRSDQIRSDQTRPDQTIYTVFLSVNYGNRDVCQEGEDSFMKNKQIKLVQATH